MTAPAMIEGQIPPGRWVCTIPEVEAAYVTGQAGAREAIWAEWQALTTALQEAVGEIPACWLSGSFFSAKLDPNDIDCVYIIDTERLLDATTSDRSKARFIQAVARSQVKRLFQVRIDSFILEWMPSPGPDKVVWAREYYERRGYWDDLWSRIRDEDGRLDSIPRRGYLEVYLDGYK